MSSKFFLTKLQENRAFSVIEALMAMTFMTLVLIALLGLLSASVKAISSSKVSTIATQIANEYIEKVRAMSYDQVGISGGNPSGMLSAEETKTVSGIQFTINHEVVWVDDSADGTSTADANGSQDYKQVSVSVSWVNEQQVTRTVNAVTFVKYKAAQSESPTVNFVHGDHDPVKTPPDGTIFGTDGSPYEDWFTSGSIPLKASATDVENDLVSMRFYVGGITPSNGLYQISPTGSYENSPVCWWNPNATDSFGVPLWGEGTHEVVVEVWDSHGLRDAKSIFWTIDKFPPKWLDSQPANLSAQVLDNVRIKLTWQSAWDGPDIVERYRVYRQADAEGFVVDEDDLNAPDLNYTDEGLSEWATYQYYITALSVGGRESTTTSNTISAKVIFWIDGIPAKVTGDRQVTIQWNSPPLGITVNHYNLYRDDVIDGQVDGGVKVNADPIDDEDTSFIDNNPPNGLQGHTTYEYKVIAYSSADDSNIINQSIVKQVTTVN